MAAYRFRNYLGVFTTLILLPLHFLTDVLFPALRAGLDIAFPASAAAEKMHGHAITSLAVVYGVALSRTRAFLARVAARLTLRQGYGALGLAPA